MSELCVESVRTDEMSLSLQLLAGRFELHIFGALQGPLRKEIRRQTCRKTPMITCPFYFCLEELASLQAFASNVFQADTSFW